VSGANSKSSATVGSGLKPAQPTAGAVKFTVEDASLKLGSVTSTSVKERTITFNYSGATLGKTLSAMIIGMDNKVKYYGKLVDNSASFGTASVTVPEGCLATDSLWIFIEECHGDQLTDFASSPLKLPVDMKAITKTDPPKTEAVDLSKANVSIADMAWSGKQLKPAQFSYNGKSYAISANATVMKYGANKKHRHRDSAAHR